MPLKVPSALCCMSETVKYRRFWNEKKDGREN